MPKVAILLLVGWAALADVPAAEAQPLLRRLEERLRQSVPAAVPPLTTSSQPRLGVVVSDVTPAAISEHGLVVRRGALITQIEPGSAADRAGLPVGGAIVAADGIRIDSPTQLVNLVRSARAGQQIELTYYQGSRLYRKRLSLTPSAAPNRSPLPEVPDLPEALPEPMPAPDAIPPRVGERPLLDRLGRVLEGIATIPPGEAPPTASGRGVPAGDSELRALREQVELLRAQVELLTKRLAELEKRLD